MNNLDIANKLYAHAVYFGGITVDNNGKTIKPGYCAGNNSTGLKFDSISQVNVHVLSAWIKKNKYKKFGSWLDKKNGSVYFDVVNIYKTKKMAINRAKLLNEIAIYNLSNNKEIRV